MTLFRARRSTADSLTVTRWDLTELRLHGSRMTLEHLGRAMHAQPVEVTSPEATVRRWLFLRERDGTIVARLALPRSSEAPTLHVRPGRATAEVEVADGQLVAANPANGWPRVFADDDFDAVEAA